MKTIQQLKNKHILNDIYVVGSGPSLDYIDPSFFENKIVIGVNQVFKKIKCDYIVRKECKFIDESLNTGAKVITSEYEYGNVIPERLITGKYDHENLYFYKHSDNEHQKIDVSFINKVTDTDKLVVSYSTITTAIHFAAFLGATNIIIVGHDCGTINNKQTFTGYYNSIKDTPWQDWSQYKQWLKLIEDQTLMLKEKLIDNYDVNVVSINPFINFNLEGNTYR